MSETIVKCDRCGKPCRGSRGDPSARIFRKAMKGHCATCHVITFIKQLDEMHGGHMLVGGPESLLLPHVQERFAAVMRAGKAQADAAEIDWDEVVANWGDDKPEGGLF